MKTYNVVVSFGSFDNFDIAHDVTKKTVELIGKLGYTAKGQVYETKYDDNFKSRYNTDTN